MILKRLLALFSILASLNAVGAPKESGIALPLPDGELKGTLSTPDATSQVPLILFIAGSGPTDRDGNGPGMKNDSLKKLAHVLSKAGIASVRFDKRGIGESSNIGPAEADLRLEHYVDDAVAWLTFLKRDARFSKIFILGHSEGSLIGMLAANRFGADGFISVAGPSVPADALIRQQLKGKLPATLEAESDRIISSLAKGATVPTVPAELNALFRPSVQPYLISWFKYDPMKVFSQIRAPSLIIQGTTDLQISVEAAQNLHRARPASSLVIIPGMNHVLKMAKGGELAQIAAYMVPTYAVSDKLTQVVTDFVKGI